MIAFDAASNSTYQAASSSYSWAHTCSGTNRILVVSIALLNVANDVATLSYAGVSMTRLRSDVDGTGTIRTDIYYLLAPATGANNIAITLNSASVSATMASSYTGVDQHIPAVVDAQNGTTGTTGAGGGSASISTTIVTEGAWLIDAVATTDTSITVGAGQNQRSNVTGAVGSGGQSDRSALAAGGQNMQWDAIGALLNWTMSTIALLPAITAGTTTSTSSTSASTFSTSSTSSSLSTSSTSFSSTSTSLSTSSTSYSMSITTMSTSSTSSSISSTSMSSTSASTSVSSTSSSISSTSMSSTSQSSTSSSTSQSSTSSSFSSTSSSQSSTSRSTSSTSFSSTSSSSSTSTTAIPSNLIYSYEDRAPTTITQQFIKTGTWVCPANVSSVIAECWGGGGGGGGGLGATGFGGGGGGGGAYSKKTISVTPGTSYTVTVGAAGAAGAAENDGTAGGDTSFVNTATVLAKGGGLGQKGGNGGGAGGAAGTGVGDITTSGGNGAAGTGTGGSGGGGGSGGDKNSGGNAATSTAGKPGATVGGYGGAGAAIGLAPGGAGGGASAVAGAGAAGAAGLVILTYTTSGLPTTGSSVTNAFTSPLVADVSGDDEDYFIEFGSDYMIREYKKDWINNTDTPSFTWRGRTTESTVTSPMLIQIYNVNSGAWETLAVANKVPADTDFSVTVSQTTNVSNYYDANNIVTFRSYQQVI